MNTADVTDVVDKNEQPEEFFNSDTTDDPLALSQITEGWSDLAELKDSMATDLLSFVMEIERITNSPELLACLGDKRPEFDKMLNVFYSDIDRFTSNIQLLRAEHDDRTGKIASMEELNLFTRLSMSYQTLQIEIQSLLAPTMAGIILILHEVSPSHIAVKPLLPSINPQPD